MTGLPLGEQNGSNRLGWLLIGNGRNVGEKVVGETVVWGGGRFGDGLGDFGKPWGIRKGGCGRCTKNLGDAMGEILNAEEG